MVGYTHINTVDTVLDCSLDDYAEGLLDAREVSLYDMVRKSLALSRVLVPEWARISSTFASISTPFARALCPISM